MPAAEMHKIRRSANSIQCAGTGALACLHSGRRGSGRTRAQLCIVQWRLKEQKKVWIVTCDALSFRAKNGTRQRTEREQRGRGQGYVRR